MRLTSLALATALVAATATAAFAQPDVKLASTSLGDVLIGPNNLTLYTFDKDTKGKSNCYDMCAVNWPPFYAEPGEKSSNGFTKVKRKDGKLQWAINGMPLYYWKNDKNFGDTTGDGVLGVWHVVK